MKNKILLILISLFLVVQLSAREKIIFFKSDIEVLESSDVIITETIKVKAEGINIRRGIYRAIPNTYKTKNGAKFKVKYEVLEILKDGLPEDFHIVNKDGYSYIYLGNKNYFLPIGKYTYTIKYKTNKQIGYFEDFDELYWNVNGNEWNFNILKLEATITLPQNAILKNHIAYTGKKGESGKNYKVNRIADNKIKFEGTKTFGSGENMTIAVSWQKGIVYQPTTQENFMLFIKDNTIILIGLFGLFFAFITHLLNWKKVGEDPLTGTIIPLFKPPSNLSPSAMRYILKMKIDTKAYTSAIISMATKGAISIEEKGKTFCINKNEEGSNTPLTKSEETLFDSLLRNKSTFSFTDKSHLKVAGSIMKFFEAEKSLHKETYFKLNRKHLVGGIIISILTIVAMFLLRDITFSPMSLIPILMVLFSAYLGYMNIKSQTKKGFGVFGIVFLAVLFFISSNSLNVGMSSFEIKALIFIAVLLVVLNLFFVYLMQAPTIFGRKEMDKIEGFKMFLKTAEEDRLNAISKLDNTPQLFEEYLPYAIALDCEIQWGKKFKSIIEKAIESGTYTQPTWYIGRSTHFNPTRFTNNIGKNFSNSVSKSSMSPSDRSSGGSMGGGFSGGGGGGGGGGGW